MSTSTNAPQIVDPFSRTGDTVAGRTADEVALNLAAGTRLFWALDIPNKVPVHPCPDIWSLFRGHTLSLEARKALGYVGKEWERARRAAARNNVGKPSPIQPRQPAPVLVEAGES